MKKETLKVTGMTCVHCEHAVESAISALPGTVKVKANHRKGAVDVRYDETMTTHEDIETAIKRAGYEPQ